MNQAAINKDIHENVKATVILLCYNQERTIARALDSVLAQKCCYPFEILVADDCSTDSTRSICEDYARRYPDIVRMLPKAPNKGIIDNYFDALVAARGEYVADCAGDDEWVDPQRLVRSIRLLDDNPDVMAVYTDTETYDLSQPASVADGIADVADQSRKVSLDDAEWGARAVRVSGKKILHDVLNHTNRLPYVLSSALFRKGPIAEMLQTEPDVVLCRDGRVEDVPVIALLASRGDAMYLPMKGYRYYIDGESASNNLSYEKDYRFVAGVTSMVRRLGEYYGINRREQLDHYRTKFNYMAAAMRRSGIRELRTDLLRRRREWGLLLPAKAMAHLLLSYLGYRK